MPRERRERRLRRVVSRFAGCLGAVAPGQRRVLVLRSGAGAGEPLSRRAVALRLDTTVRQVARTERRGLERLRAVASAGGCGGGEAGAIVAAGGDGAGPVAGAAPEPGAAGAPEDGRKVGTAGVDVKDEFATSPSPDRTAPMQRFAVGAINGDGDPPLLPLLLAAFAAGFMAVWFLQHARGGGGAHPA